MYTFIKRTRRVPFPWVVGFILWGISGAITVSLFLTLAGGSPAKTTLAVFWAGSLEASKILTWLWGGRYRLLSVSLMALTLFSALGIALHIVEMTQDAVQNQTLTQSQEYQDRRRTVDDLQRQITVETDRLGSLPPDYISAAAGLSKSLDQLRTQLEVAQTKLKSLEGSPLQDSTGLGVFELLARMFHADRKVLEIIVILIVAILTEASAVVMAGYQPIHIEPGKSTSEEQDDQVQTPAPTPEAYLKAALDHPNAPKLLGRIEVAKRLRISEPQARKLLEALIRSGQIRRGTKSFEAESSPTTKKHPMPPKAV